MNDDSVQIPGLHHVTAIAGNPQRNLDFYTSVLGLRLIKQTVNFDSPETYHFYYGDDRGQPGTILTFFPFAGVPRGRPGVGQATAIGFAVPERALAYWSERLHSHGIVAGTPADRLDETVLSFVDPDSLPLELIARSDADARLAWQGGPVPVEHAIRGFHGVTLWVRDAERTTRMLSEILGFRPDGAQAGRERYTSARGGPGTWVDVVGRPDSAAGFEASGTASGTVHHIAWRAHDDAQELAWREKLVRHGINVTPVRDRQYFHSIYFHEPGGVLFEIATDPPGFGVDEAVEDLGTSLKLPPWLEPHRARIQRALPHLRLPATTGRR